MKFHCMFEQSGTFKKEFNKLGYDAFDYDILNNFGETDFQIDIFKEIELAYAGGASMFDTIKEEDLILAFFPCVRFEAQIIMNFRGYACGLKNWSLEQKMEYDLKLHGELHNLYCLITKLVIIAKRKNLKLVIENPYSTQHYLSRYWALEPSIIDKDRRDMGDAFQKPTQYWFVNCEPKNNFIFESLVVHKTKKISNCQTVERSMITPDYAKRFIREFLIEGENHEELY